MSSQRGNVKKSRPPKHTNNSAFKNSLHDTSKKTKAINNLDVSGSGVCFRCKDILEWKIKYKKYKPLTQPKKCTKCQQKRVKHAYHIICSVCTEDQGVCGKCGQKVDQQDGGHMDNGEDMEQDLAYLSERERRSYLRAQEKGTAAPKEVANAFKQLHLHSDEKNDFDDNTDDDGDDDEKECR